MTGSKVGPRGPLNARIVVVGEAPGAYEEREGRPFIGPSGHLLEELLASVGINPAEVFYTNLARYRPPGNAIRAFVDNDGIPNEILLEGLTELKEELTLVRPNLIIPLGNYPLRFLTDKGRWRKTEGAFDYTGIGDFRGSILEGNALCGGAKTLPTYHPAAILRQYPLKHIVRTDLTRALEQSRFPEIRRPAKHIVLDPRGTERAAWLAWLESPPGTPSPCGAYPSASFLTSDIEYIGSHLLCLGATRHADVAVVLRTASDRDIAEIRSLLLSGIPLCFQNSMFDCSILEWFFDIPCLQFLRHDTMVAMHVSYTEFPKDLGFIGSLFTEQPFWKDAVDWKKVGEGTQPIEDVLTYNAIDTWVTHDAMEKMLTDELTEACVRNEYEYEMSLIKPLWAISKRGVRIDTEAMTRLRETLQEEVGALLYGLATLNDGYEVNPRSGDQCAAFLYEKLGVRARGLKTKGGKWMMDDTTLAELALTLTDKRQLTGLRMIRKCRERLSLISKFCNIKLDDDGRIRCHYDPAKTDTSRLSSRKFYPTRRGANLQNTPRDDRVRAVFIPDPGMFFGYADLKSAESLVVAHITGDREMLRLHSDEYMSGRLDGHKYVASFLLNKQMEKLTNDERYLGKRVRHAGNYTLSWKKLQSMINTDTEDTGVSVTAAQAKVLITKYRQLHPGLKNWWDDVLKQLWSTHTIFTQLGRKRVFYDRPDAILPDAIAYNPQGTVAKALNIGLLRAAADKELQGLGFQILLQVHDAIGFQGPVENRDQINHRLVELMRVTIPIARRGVEPYTIEIPVEVKVGGNWGEASETNPNGLKVWSATNHV